MPSCSHHKRRDIAAIPKRHPIARLLPLFLLRNYSQEETVATTYRDLLAQKAKLEEQLEAARAAEVETAIAQVRQIVLEYGLTAEDIGLAAKTKKRKGSVVQPKYQDPKSGSTWTGRGRAPAWIAGKNYERFLIK
ncbi:hypothetical protein RSP822_17150 [Ralstonia solanacearum]|nr:hypothetical protein RSP822_17150 [Ralstonia solanacearum]